MLNNHGPTDNCGELVDHLAKVADDQSLLLAIGAEPTPARERIAAILAEHHCASPCKMLTALDRYDRALVQVTSLLDAVRRGELLPSAVQDSIDVAQLAYLEATGQEPLSLLQLSTTELDRNPFRMCKDA